MWSDVRVTGLAAALLLGTLGLARAETMTQAEAEAFVAPFYAALADAGTADIGAVLSAIAVPDYRSYASNETGTPAAEVAAGLNGFGTAVPDLDWRVVEVIPADGKIIVRGEATGTPVAPLFGVPPSGQSFRIMSIDIWTVAGGKLVSIHHVEDWATGIRQLSGG